MFGKNIELEDLNRLSIGTMAEFLEMEVTEIGSDYLRMRMPVVAKVKQPLGLLHGGASLAIAEQAGSLAANVAAAEGTVCVGLEINGNHVRSITQGYVHAVARPVHLGKRTQIWEIRMEDDAGNLTCISRLTMAVLDKKQGL